MPVLPGGVLFFRGVVHIGYREVVSVSMGRQGRLHRPFGGFYRRIDLHGRICVALVHYRGFSTLTMACYVQANSLFDLQDRELMSLSI